ncbi:hypothetical protein SLEP1_g55003 [Rubroshorea leprosula]|uniref:Disease resistance RPP13-like protein 1 n=1 Tax=Rubroshorea leprosula TaxID=152421 RepID=A0AAV5MHA1_9ROSI|nr:hypothetical protein SLEP1_g55003 [Rubroshorea leprosula]
MDILSFIGSSLLSTIYDMLSEKLKDYLSDQLRNSDEEVHPEMEHWKILLPKITAVLQHAEENQVTNQFMKLHLDDLKDLAYDMEDILEEFVIDAKSKVDTNKGQKGKSNPKNLFRSKAKPNQEINSMVNHLNVRLQRIEKEMDTLGCFNFTMKVEDKSRKVATERLLESALLKDKVWGRGSDRDTIIQRLLEDGGSLEEDFVIPIVGMGGLGKTTLARFIYNDKRLEGKFDLKAWVCVSDESDIPRITRNILEYVTEEKYDFENFSLLQEKLDSKLSGRKFFLVLDDVWDEQCKQWSVLKKPLMSGAPGSKIIVTTRSEEVGKKMGKDDGIYCLKLLEDDACLSLFTQHALRANNFDGHPHLKDIGEELVRKCKGLPLAITTLSGLLRGKPHPVEWESILNNEIWHISENRSEILPALRLSYNHLPSYLKPCFAYCALFPKDYEFDEMELIQLWMAEGLLQRESHGKKQMEEDIGHQYFQELLSRSLFQSSSRVESRFVMHDLINDLAINVAGKMYCNLGSSMDDEKLEKARHLSFTPHFFELSERFRVLDELKHFRTFLPLRALNDNRKISFLSNKILHHFLPTLNRLRVLSLRSYQIKLSELPTTIGNLIDLHHLDITDTPSLKEMPSGIGDLKNLVILSKFIVGKASGMMMRLSALKNLSQLRGTLSILDLENVLHVQDVGEANLDKIHGLEELVFKWGWIVLDNDRHESVLSQLKPHSNLKSLKISHYGGKSFPKWVCDPSLFLKLSSMELSYCQRCTLLPSFGLLPVLKKLIIKSMTAIKAVGPEFYGQHDSFRSLEKLKFEHMLNWKEWTSPTGSEGEFPCLHRLVIQDCPKLGQLPSNLSSLKELTVEWCNAMLPTNFSSLKELTVIGCNAMFLKNCEDLTCLWEEGAEIEQNLLPFNLKHLSLWGCRALESLPNAIMMDDSSSSNSSMLMSRLEKLKISGCNSLKSFPRGKLPIPLKYLIIEGCRSLESLPDVDGNNNNSNLHLEIRNVPCLYSSEDCHQPPAFLKKFEVRSCDWLESFPDRMLQHCTGLQSINIYSCKILKSLPSLACITNLIELSIYHCEALGSLPEELGLCTPNLKDLKIGSCQNFKSLPNTMYQLKSLQILWMQKCCGIEFIPDGGLPPNLTELRLWCKNLKRLPNTMYQLTSLKHLTVSGGALMSLQRLTIAQNSPLDIVLPSSLTCLEMESEENLESIPGGLFQNLSSLQELWIHNCPRLQSLPREAFPPSLGRLQISRCPHLKRQRFEEKGDYWTLTWSIPNVWIYEDVYEDY